MTSKFTQLLFLSDSDIVCGLVCAGLSEFILFARKSDVRLISLDVEDRTDVVVPLTGLRGVVAVDWDRRTDDVYWSDVTGNSVSRACWDGTRQQV